MPPPDGRAAGSGWVMAVVVLGTLMASVDTTIVLLAFPTIAGDLHANLTLVLWTILIYLLLTAILTTQFGRLGDLFGRSRLYNLGFGIFTAGSALCGASPSIEMLIGFRAVQAVGGAFMVATGTAIVSQVFPPATRGRAFGYTSMGWNVGATLGIVLGGVLTTYFGWRYIFFINVPIGAVALALGLRYLPPSPRSEVHLDLTGLLLLGGAVALLAYGATDFATYGLTTANLAYFGVGAALFGPFLLWERRARFPTLDLRLFRSRLLSSSLAASFVQSLGYLSVVFLLIMYLQGIRGLSPLDASLLLVPGYVLSSILSPRAGRWADRWGAWRFATGGIVLMIGGVLLYAFLGASTPYGYVVGVSILTGVGGALFWPSNNKAVMHDAPPQQYGAVAGLLRTLSNLGTIGSYVLAITVASAAIPRYLAFEVFAGTGGLIGTVSTAFLHALHSSFYVMAAVLVVAGLLSFSRRTLRASAGPRAAPARGPSREP